MRLATRAALLAAVFAVALPALAQPQTTLYPGGSGQPLLDAIRGDYTPNLTLGYDRARDSLYAYEQRTDGQLCGVYTHYCVTLRAGADPSTDAYNKGINAEHTWPQSLGAGSEPARSDLHHLFPAKDNVNSSRGNHPYGEIPDSETDTWYRESASQTSIPTVFIGEWSEKDNANPAPGFSARFEPRDDHKGDAARAVFYFRTIYPAAIASAGGTSFFEVMKSDLIVWHYADPVNLSEYARSAWIASLQGTPNPYILDSTLARRAFSLTGVPPDSTGNEGPGDPDDGEPGSGGVLWVNELHYDNASTDADEGVEIAGPAGTSLAGWTLVLYNGSDNTAYDTVALAGTIPDQEAGFGTVWTAIPGLQNGAPDGLALVDPDDVVVEFLSYEGSLTASGGAADGLTAIDIGVEETGTTPLGYSLQRTGEGHTAADFTWAEPQAATPGQPNIDQTFVFLPVAWINELHYDNASTDANEGVEIAGTAGLDLTGWSVVLYNGSGGAVYDTIALSGTIDDEGTGFGALWFDRSGIQNGSPDGLALVDGEGTVVEFLSYEGGMTANGGAADGLASTDIGVEETGSTGTNESLQRTGEGVTAAAFEWVGPRVQSRGILNAGQIVGDPGPRATATETAPAALEVTAYPNPTRGRTTVALRLDAPAAVAVEVYDAIGRRVATVDAGPLGAGFQSVELGLHDVPAGVYLVRVTAGTHVAVLPLSVVR